MFINNFSYDKNDNVVCLSSKNLDQPWHLPSRIRVSIVSLCKSRIISYPKSVHWRLIRLSGYQGWFESSNGICTYTLLILLWCLNDCTSLGRNTCILFYFTLLVFLIYDTDLYQGVFRPNAFSRGPIPIATCNFPVGGGQPSVPLIRPYTKMY